MVDIPRNGLYGDDETADHLWEHRLELYHAQEVWDGPAKYFRQLSRRIAEPGSDSWPQPERTVMIGPDFGGRLLTFILELPGTDRRSRVITGWGANADERTRYNRPGGRMRDQ